MTPPEPQMCVPTRDVVRPRLTIIGSYLSGGRLYRCDCGAEVWSNFGHAKRHDAAHDAEAASQRPRRRRKP